MEIQVTGCRTCPFIDLELESNRTTRCTHPNMMHNDVVLPDIYNKSRVLTGCPLLIDVTTIILTNYKQPKL